MSFYNALVRESYGDLANLLHTSLPLGSPEAQRSFTDAGTPRGGGFRVCVCVCVCVLIWTPAGGLIQTGSLQGNVMFSFLHPQSRRSCGRGASPRGPWSSSRDPGWCSSSASSSKAS